MKIVLLDAITFGNTDLSCFNEFGEVEVFDSTEASLTNVRVKEAEVIVTNKVVITREHMQNAKKLKLICVAATGTNNVDLKAAKELGIAVKNVAGYSTDSVIQHTFSMLFYLIGHSRYYDEVVKNGEYSKSGIFTDVSHPFFEIKGKKWGIIGLGEIGRGVANIAKCFGAEVCYYSTSGVNRTEDFQRMNLDELLKSCDIISIHAPLNDKTKNLLDYEQLLICKEGAVVLNLGRGGIINEAAVAKVVDEKNIFFGLDVFEKEPLPLEGPLLHVKNKSRLYMTPHIAWTSVEARDKLIAGVCENIKSSLTENK
ncbi:D-2-hydroxyacid dehydrogenase [Sulfurimonas autotrophica]|uniref:D-isomer specific 2-hydroxyacid dehydrogenase NAD-binding protein n=1 Tax=Sulfurimonas autotrophica (strain ATCC BAA-671 / DSM 16294 / JCM 11897 / OK10) TaxID=563040 RepID=E0USR8_SULAO|nr:D-2-hydroxyacid dehydrogenase [Sulfurimonas autotrophica]ADN08095.1 D-isomer specific 2-hydroxyacid dehydrogenase NAD-binding protein [Sulfurimonas autotrophica DSM 16294]